MRNDEARMTNVEGTALRFLFFRHSSFVIRHFPTTFRAPKDSEHLSTYLAQPD
jgi:hypothetical protein